MLQSFTGWARQLVLLLFLSSAVASAGWAGTVEGLSAEEVAALEQRVEARWQALIARDYDAVYEFSTPAYRSVFPRNLFELQFSYAVERELTGIEVTDYDAAAAVASVAVRVMSKPVKLTSTASQSLGALPVTVHEKWIRVDGKWWHSASY